MSARRSQVRRTRAFASFGAILPFFVSPAVAGTAYTCSNVELLAVTCSETTCEVGDTGLLTVAIDGFDYLVVCGQTQCWSGPGTRQTSGVYEVIAGVGLQWQLGGEGKPNDAVLAFDPRTGMGTILAPPFASPIRCMVHPGE